MDFVLKDWRNMNVVVLKISEIVIIGVLQMLNEGFIFVFCRVDVEDVGDGISIGDERRVGVY